jgi:methyl-branched lipid omega-hydroxylase
MTEHPDQRALWESDFEKLAPTAVEEIVRWASPVIFMRRTLTGPATLSGQHFCLGAHLARREITVMFRELFRRLPDISAIGEPSRLRSNLINGFKHLPCAFTPA